MFEWGSEAREKRHHDLPTSLSSALTSQSVMEETVKSAVPLACRAKYVCHVLTLFVAVAATATPGAVSAQPEPAPNPMGGVRVSGVIGAHTNTGSDRRPGVIGGAIAWERPVASRLGLRVGVAGLRNVQGDYGLSCVQLPDGGCASPPQFPRAVWSLEGTMVLAPFERRGVVLLAGGGAVLGRGNAFNEASRPEGVGAVWRLGVEFGGSGVVGFQLTYAGYTKQLLSVKGTTAGAVVLRIR